MQHMIPASFTMPLTTLFARRSAQHMSNGTTVQASNDTTIMVPAEPVHHKRNSSGGRIAAGFRKIFSGRDHDNSTSQVSVDTPSSQLSESQRSRPSSPETASTPPSTAGSSSPGLANKNARTDLEPAATSPEVSPTTESLCEAPIHATTGPHDDIVSAAPAQESNHHDAIMAAYAKAEEILAARHATLQTKAEDGKGLKKHLGLKLKNITAKEAAKAKETHTAGAGPSLPRPEPAPRSTEVRRQPQTASDAMAMLERRERIMSITYGAVFYGCQDAYDKLERLNNHFCDRDSGLKPLNADIVIGFGDYHLRANDLGFFEHTWIARYNYFRLFQRKLNSREISIDDYEFLVEQLFPADDAQLLDPEDFDIYLEPLVEEGIFDMDQFLLLRDLGVSQEEMDRTIHYTHPDVAPRVQARRNADNKYFRMPQRAMRTGSIDLPGQPRRDDNLHQYLQLLVEAAVYKQTHYRGFYFGNAAAELGRFHQAYALSEKDKLLPPELTDYNRSWTYAESRLLERGQLLCNLLKQYQAGTITDFGVLRVVRATLVPLPGQPRFGRTYLEKMLYDRSVGAGMAIHQIPEILSLMREHDSVMSCPTVRQTMIADMQNTAVAFEAEEKIRLADIKADRRTFKKQLKKELGVWGRVKRKAKGVFGRKKAVVEAEGFNPFSPEHGSCVPEGKADGSFYA